MKLHLIRHPQSLGNVLGINDCLEGDLTDNGVWQLELSASRLAGEQFDTIYTSPALRCMRLAEAIGRTAGQTPIVDYELRERDYGSLVGRAGGELLKLGIDDRPTRGESVRDVYRRATRTLRRLQGQQVLVVSHGLFLKMLVCAVIGMDMRTALQSLKFSNCAVSLLDTSTKIVEYLNDRTHLKYCARRIHVFGGWASGKTSVAASLGNRLGLPVFHLDDVKYTDGFARSRPVARRLSLLEEITARPEWITEGAWTDYANIAFSRADLLLYLRGGYVRSLVLAAKRECCRRRPEGVSFVQLLVALTGYHFGAGKVSRQAHDAYRDRFNHKTVCMGASPTSAIVREVLTWCSAAALRAGRCGLQREGRTSVAMDSMRVEGQPVDGGDAACCGARSESECAGHAVAGGSR